MTAEELIKAHGSVSAAARAEGLTRSGMQHRLRHERKNKPAVSSEIEYPDLPSSELTPQEIIDHAKKYFASHLAARDARRWFEIKIKNNQPIGVAFVGDPHIDDKGTNWVLFDEHIKLLQETEGLYAIGGNDLANNWVGRLMRLYSDSKMTQKETWKIIKYLFKDSGIRWLVHVLGNHDLWNDGPILFRANAGVVPVEDWQARFVIGFPNNTKIRVHMAHDFPGTSQYNMLHGAKKQALWGEQADIYACAHKHSWAMTQEENPHRNDVYWMIRSRGYKFMDSFADVHGFGSQRHGATITAIINPRADGPARIQCFADMSEAAQYLTWLRGRN
jgi:hypothetical protein